MPGGMKLTASTAEEEPPPRQYPFLPADHFRQSTERPLEVATPQSTPFCRISGGRRAGDSAADVIDLRHPRDDNAACLLSRNILFLVSLPGEISFLLPESFTNPLSW